MRSWILCLAVLAGCEGGGSPSDGEAPGDAGRDTSPSPDQVTLPPDSSPAERDTAPPSTDTGLDVMDGQIEDADPFPGHDAPTDAGTEAPDAGSPDAPDPDAPSPPPDTAVDAGSGDVGNGVGVTCLVTQWAVNAQMCSSYTTIENDVKFSLIENPANEDPEGAITADSPAMRTLFTMDPIFRGDESHAVYRFDGDDGRGVGHRTGDQLEFTMDAGRGGGGNPCPGHPFITVKCWGTTTIVNAQHPDAAVADAPPPDASSGGDVRPSVEIGDYQYLLVTDTSQNLVYLMLPPGAVVQMWTSPVTEPTGLAIDRRDVAYFWVVGRGNPNTFYRLSYYGIKNRSFENDPSLRVTDIRGLDYFLGATAADDRLGSVAVNAGNIQVFNQNSVVTGGLTGGVAFRDSSSSPFLSGFNACVLLGFETSGAGYPLTNVVCTRDRGVDRTIERRQGGSDTSGTALTIPLDDARGFALLPDGGYIVVDQPGRRIVQLDSTGGIVGAVAAPGPAPFGVALVPRGAF